MSTNLTSSCSRTDCASFTHKTLNPHNFRIQNSNKNQKNLLNTSKKNLELHRYYNNNHHNNTLDAESGSFNTT